jgi:alpha-methylacyl-CoA racemase
MLLADLGAHVLRVESPPSRRRVARPTGPSGVDAEFDVQLRGRAAILLDLKTGTDLEAARTLAGNADVLIEGYRPGVMERLGLGATDCLNRNPRLIYARVTGWGQSGPLSNEVGHDINYLGLTGLLDELHRDGERPAAPRNLIADFGGGSLFAVAGILAALHERTRSGAGQVVDVAMVDGVSVLAQMLWAKRGANQGRPHHPRDPLAGDAPFYDTYECGDGKRVAVGALEDEYWANLIVALGLASDELPSRLDERNWPSIRAVLARCFRTRSRDEWADRFRGREACVTPVLSFDEAAVHPQLSYRETVIAVDGVHQAAPAPRFSVSGTGVPVLPKPRRIDREAALAAWLPSVSSNTTDLAPRQEISSDV